ncbi:hypothetical protein, partial [Pseudomonas helleri]
GCRAPKRRKGKSKKGAQAPKSVDNSLKIEVSDDAATEPKARALERLTPTKRSAVERSRTAL